MVPLVTVTSLTVKSVIASLKVKVYVTSPVAVPAVLSVIVRVGAASDSSGNATAETLSMTVATTVNWPLAKVWICALLSVVLQLPEVLVMLVRVTAVPLTSVTVTLRLPLEVPPVAVVTEVEPEIVIPLPISLPEMMLSVAMLEMEMVSPVTCAL